MSGLDLRLLLPLLGLAFALPSLGIILASGLKPGSPKPYLALVLLEVALYFASELLAGLPGRPPLALVCNYASALYGMPALYFFARESLGAGPRRAWPHFVPALANLLLGTLVALTVAARGYRGGWGTAAYLVGIEAFQTAQLLVYGRLVLALVPRGKATEWPRRTVVAVLTGYAIFLTLAWVSFGFSLASEILGRRVAVPQSLDISALLAIVLLAWTLGLCALWGRDRLRAGPGAPKYGGRPLAQAEAQDLLQGARALLEAEEDLAGPDAEPRALAERLGVPYYLLSRAVNEEGGLTVAELVNEYRIGRAKALLLARPEASILEVALDSGFQAKSTFNEVFRRHTGQSPRAFREAPGQRPGKGQTQGS